MNRENKIIGVVAIAAASITALAMVITIFSSNSNDDVVIKFQDITSISEENQTIFSTESTKNTTKTENNSQKAKTTQKTSKNKSSSGNTSSITFPIDLNTANLEELCEIDGIGEVIAQKIINLRENLGGYFKNRYQLLKVDGIGEKKLESIWEYLYIENEEFDDESSSDNYESYDASKDTETSENKLETLESKEKIYINLNTADFDDLMQIPDITEEICTKILDLREEITYFSDTHELLYIDQITNELYTKIEMYVYVENKNSTPK